MDQGKVLYFMEFLLHYIHFAESFMGSVKQPSFSVCLNLNHEKTNSHNFNFGNFSSCPVKL